VQQAWVGGTPPANAAVRVWQCAFAPAYLYVSFSASGKSLGMLFSTSCAIDSYGMLLSSWGLAGRGLVVVDVTVLLFILLLRLLAT